MATLAEQFAGDVAQYSAFAAVTKAVTALPDGPCRGLLVAAAGTVVITDMGGNSVTIPLIAGFNPVRCSVVNLGGTATNIFACY